MSAEEQQAEGPEAFAEVPVTGRLGAESAPTGPKHSLPSWLSLGLRLFALAVVISLVGLLVQRTLAKREGPHLLAAIKADRKPLAPDFNLDVLWPRAETWPTALRAAIADGKVSVRELRGHPVVLNFWASWCVPCKAEAPRLVSSARAHSGEVAFLGIDIQDFKSDARTFLTRYDTNYVSVRDGGQSTYEDYGLTGIPETYYLDARGRVVAHALGEVSPQELEAGIAQAVEGSS